MRYLALATDYDGTLASDGRVGPSTIQALELLRKTGRRLLLVTGRELPDLKRVCPRLDLFDCVVAENGALLYLPGTQSETVLAEAPPPQFLDCLKRHQVQFSVGRSIVATTAGFAEQVLHAIQETGVELQVIFNKGAAMVLPTGVNKATGLETALKQLGLSMHNVVSVGDAENDHALLASCEFGAAVANAVPLLKQRADWVAEGARGQGVEQLIERIIADDLRSLDESVHRHRLLIGHSANDGGNDIFLAQPRASLLLAGPSGSGKSSMTSALVEQMIERKYQFCLIDPEGNYDGLPGAIVIGTPTDGPNIAEIEKALEAPSHSILINLLAIPLPDRPLFFARLLARLLELRTRRGRPHWIIVDDARHLLPRSWDREPGLVPQTLGGLLLVTVDPAHVAHAALQSIDTLIALGHLSGKTINDFAHAMGEKSPAGLPSQDLPPGHAVVWLRRSQSGVGVVRMATTRSFERLDRVRRYPENELTEDIAFYFRGPEGRLNLRVEDLNMLVQISDGVDDETWLYHLQRGEYSGWMRRAIKDDLLGAEVERVEREVHDPMESRKRIKSAIQRRYTAVV
jgi:hydroxymethylpyrimidine pyrophosphatase-like HAD family hydrolase